LGSFRDLSIHRDRQRQATLFYTILWLSIRTTENYKFAWQNVFENYVCEYTHGGISIKQKTKCFCAHAARAQPISRRLLTQSHVNDSYRMLGRIHIANLILLVFKILMYVFTKQCLGDSCTYIHTTYAMIYTVAEASHVCCITEFLRYLCYPFGDKA
jgi:hypothetical protein